MTDDERTALDAFEQSQRSRARLSTVIATLVAVALIALQGYRVWLRHEASQPIVIDARPKHQKLGLTADEYEAQLRAERAELERRQAR